MPNAWSDNSMPAPNYPIWTGSPSWLYEITLYIICLAVIIIIPRLAIMCVTLAGWRVIVLYCISYELYDDRIVFKHGVFNRIEENLELYRIKDVQVQRPLIMRMVGLGHTILMTSDKSRDIMVFEAIPDASDIAYIVRNLSEKKRDEKGVKEFDVR